MSSDLPRDLELWEAGLLAADVLEGRYPDADVRGLLEQHGRLRSAASAPVPPSERVWTRVTSALPTRSRSRANGVLRLAFALVIALLILPGVAYASAPEIVERAGAEVIHAGFHVVGGHPHPHPSPAQSPGPSPHPSPTPHPSPSGHF